MTWIIIFVGWGIVMAIKENTMRNSGSLGYSFIYAVLSIVSMLLAVFMAASGWWR